MRSLICAVIIILSFVPQGCKEAETLKFCEGVRPDGEEVNCGNIFSAGDLLILIKSDENFGVDRLSINIYEEKKLKKEIVETIVINVKPEEKSASADIRLYKEGKYKAEVTGKKSAVIPSGRVKIVEAY